MNHPCIETDKKICGGFPVIKGTRTRVVSIAIEYEYINRTHGEIISARPTSSWDKYTTPYPTTTKTETNWTKR